VGNLSKAFVMGNLFLALFLGGILQEMFAHINKLQLIIHSVIINVMIPAHTMIYFNALFGFATFQIFNFRPMLTKIFALTEDVKIVSRNAYLLGYSSTFFVSNMNNIFILFLLTCFCGLFIYFARNSQNQRVQEYRRRTLNVLRWNGVYEIIRQPYIVFVCSCIINTLALTWQNTGVGISNILMFASIFLIFSFPAWTIWFILRNKQRLNERVFYGLYGRIYHNLRWNKLEIQKLVQPGIETARVLIVCLALFYFNKVRTFQWIACIVMHFAVVTFNGTIYPFRERSHFYWQQINE
jgi:hypothetical protein